MSDYRQKILHLHQSLGIPEDYESQYGLPLQYEAQQLVSIGNDIYQRPQQLIPAAADAWSDMQNEALNDKISLDIVSAFRSVERQYAIVERKRDAGQSWQDILSVSAAPGYSEHHTGRAIDITTANCEALCEDFENTDAFYWLNNNASRFSFSLSYPKNNAYGILYEPWHWAFSEE